jgi:hypothetical protein
VHHRPRFSIRRVVPIPKVRGAFLTRTGGVSNATMLRVGASCTMTPVFVLKEKLVDRLIRELLLPASKQLYYSPKMLALAMARRLVDRTGSMSHSRHRMCVGVPRRSHAFDR